MEKFRAEVEQSQTLSQEETETTATIPFATTDISGISLDAPSGSGSSSSNGSRLHIATDLHLENKFEPVRVVAGQDRSENIGNYISVARRRGLPQLNLQQAETYIFELPNSSNQSLEPEVADAKDAKDTNIPTIQVNPPIPQNPELEPVAPESLDSSLLTVSQPRLSSIKDRIMLFERTCFPPSVSTEPATAVCQGADTQENSATTPLTPSINMVELNSDRIGAGCCTVEPSQVLVEHMQPKADAEVEAHSGCHQMEEAQRLEQPNPTLDQEIDLMIERALNEVNKMAVAPNEVDKLRNYLQANKDRFNKLVQYQYDESLRMQVEFDRQQKFLIKQICAEIEMPFAPLSEHTSTRSLQQHLASSSQADEPISNSMATTSGADSPYLVPMADSYIPSHPLLKGLLGTGQGVLKSSEHESKSLSGTSAASTGRSGQMPPRKSNLKNSKRPAARSASTVQKSNNCRAPEPVLTGVAFQRVVGGGGGSVGSEGLKKTSLGRGNGTATRSRSTARRPPQGQQQQQQQQRSASKARKTSTPKRGRNVSSHK
ncbi:uncharacterized protein LOC108158014 [Drosophila miranda]|uniref:uncharacterized protein LOC108158014 n=1 Tax=Drosophila miranda TaxID=7229 RepID=UPI0007E86C24|nr:uncharacterized protein LOC108158014 [Drosophila miranda]